MKEGYESRAEHETYKRSEARTNSDKKETVQAKGDRENPYLHFDLPLCRLQVRHLGLELSRDENLRPIRSVGLSLSLSLSLSLPLFSSLSWSFISRLASLRSPSLISTSGSLSLSLFVGTRQTCRASCACISVCFVTRSVFQFSASSACTKIRTQTHLSLSLSLSSLDLRLDFSSIVLSLSLPEWN